MVIRKYKKFLENLEMGNMWNIIPDSVKELHELFKADGKKLFVVGGAVRDFLNNEKPKDFDLATDATPDEVMSILGGVYRVKLQGEAFGVVVVFTHDQPMGMEVATFREDLYDGLLGKTRNPEVKFTTIDKDVQRRDITFNGLFYDLDKREIVDLVGGMEDIKYKKVRMIGDANLRIKEDPLRILRIFRFATRYNYEIDPVTKNAIFNNHDLSTISKERIWDEILKSWKQAKDFSQYLNYFTEFEMWGDIFHESNINTDVKPSNFLEVYIANLFTNEDPDKILNKMVQEYKIDIDFSRKVNFLLEVKNLQKYVDSQNIITLYRKKEISRLTDDVIMEWCKISGLYNVEIFLKYRPSVSAEDLMSKGFKGKSLGDELKKRETEKFLSMTI